MSSVILNLNIYSLFIELSDQTLRIYFKIQYHCFLWKPSDVTTELRSFLCTHRVLSLTKRWIFFCENPRWLQYINLYILYSKCCYCVLSCVTSIALEHKTNYDWNLIKLIWNLRTIPPNILMRGMRLLWKSLRLHLYIFLIMMNLGLYSNVEIMKTHVWYISSTASQFP